MNVSVVIPTRNRRAELDALLESLGEQSFAPAEVIVVDSSEPPEQQEKLRRRHPGLPLSLLTSEASVCVQRNVGIRHATSPLVFVCDDDMIVPPPYIKKLRAHLLENPDVMAASGRVVEPLQGGEQVSQYPVANVGQLLYRFIFQLSIWGDIGHLETSWLGRPLYKLLRRYYERGGNRLSPAGWPLVTSFSSPAFRCPVWGLGASILRREVLEDPAYDEIFDRHGIGDNFDLSLRLPGELPVAVVTDAEVIHGKSEVNRLESDLSHYRRTLTLHYFLVRYPQFSWWNRAWYVWSIVGKYLLCWKRGQTVRRKSLAKILRLVITGRNPYVLAWKRGGERFVQPMMDAATG